MNMAQVDGQRMKQSLHVGALPIPGGEAVNGERVPQVVQPWLLSRSIGSADAGAIAQNAEVMLEGVRLYRRIHPRSEGQILRPWCSPSRPILSQNLAQLRAQWDQARLAELRVADG